MSSCALRAHANSSRASPSQIVNCQLSAIVLRRCCLSLASSAFAQAPVNGAGNRKQATATRVPNGSIRVDGRLDDEAWQKARRSPTSSRRSRSKARRRPMRWTCASSTTMTSLYVGARMFSKDGRIQAPLGRRDNIDQAEHILVSFDTFLDRRTAVVYGVTAAGVRIDRYHSADQEDSFDSGYDPVWRAETSVSGDQWTAELWIPFSQLRFNPETELRVGPEPLSLPADARRGRLLDPDSAHRARLVVALRRRQRHQRRRPAAAHRGVAVRGRRIHHQRRSRCPQSVRRRQEPRRTRRRRRQDGAWSEPDARNRDQSRTSARSKPIRPK